MIKFELEVDFIFFCHFEQALKWCINLFNKQKMNIKTFLTEKLNKVELKVEAVGGGVGGR